MANKKRFWQSKKGREIRHSFAYNILNIIIVIIPFIPRAIGLKIFSFLGFIVGKNLKKERKQAENSLIKIYGDKMSPIDREKFINRMFGELGKTLFDTIYIPQLNMKKFNKYVNYDGVEYDQNGGVFITGHISCFELHSHLVSKIGYKSVAVGAPLFDKRVDALFTKLRERNNLLYLHRDNSGRKLYKALKNGYTFGSIIDQDTMNEGVFAPFLGEMAFTPTGPITLGYRLDLPIFFQYAYRDNKNRYNLVYKKCNYKNTGNREADIETITKEFNDFISKGILEHPEQWVWLHNRWRRKP